MRLYASHINGNDWGEPYYFSANNLDDGVNCKDVTSIISVGEHAHRSNSTYVEIRNVLLPLIPSNKSMLTTQEVDILRHYNLYEYFKIYDRIADGSTIISSHPPVDIDYDLLGYNKKRVFDKGELLRVEYCESYNQGTGVYSGKVVEEVRTYYRVNQMLNRREMSINWYLDDGSIGHRKTTTKYYTMLEVIQAGETRRANLISDLKITVIGLLMAASGATGIQAQNAGKPFLDSYSIEIAKYIQGFENDLKEAISNDSTYTWLNLVVPNTGGITVRQYLISELTIDYTINNIYI